MRAVGLLALLLLVAGCTVTPAFSPPSPQLSESEASSICSSLVQRTIQPESLRALVNATIKHNDESISFRYAIASRGVDRLRIDVLPLEGAITLAIFVVNEGRATLLDTQSREAVVGNDAAALLEQLLGLEGISAREVLSLLTAKLPRLQCSGVRVHPISDEKIVLVEKEARIAWSVDRLTGVVSRLQILNDEGESILLDATLSEMPKAVALQLYSPARAEGSLSVERLTENPVIPDSIFEVTIPSSYSIRD
jgi:hypothetical protein